MGKSNLAGAWGEALAAEHLRQRGYQVLVSGFRSRYGEIDLIARDGGHLVFVEVKLRKSADFAQAREAVDPRKQERLRNTAAIYLSQHPSELPARFDVVEIYAPEGTKTRTPQIHHMEDAFQ